jgi:hypothetical protein
MDRGVAGSGGRGATGRLTWVEVQPAAFVPLLLRWFSSSLQLFFRRRDPSFDQFSNAAITALLAELFESLNLRLDLHYLFRREHGASVTYRT